MRLNGFLQSSGPKITLDFAALGDEYKLDRKSGRYRNVKTGRFAARSTVLSALDANIKSQSDALVKLADKLANNQLNIKDFQREAGAIIKTIHIQSYVLGVGGLDKTTSEGWLAVARNLKAQYYSGIDPETGRKYGLKHLAQEIINGQVSLAGLRYRLGLYALSGRQSYLAGEVEANKQAGLPYAYRVLGNAEHCIECVQYSKLPPQPVDDVVLPGQRCSCRVNCKCSLVYLSVADAIAAGAKRYGYISGAKQSA